MCFTMLRTIDFDDQSCRHAGEIGHIGSYGNLSAEVTSFDFHVSQVLPENLLDVRRIRSQTTCRRPPEICDGSTSHPNTTL